MPSRRKIIRQRSMGAQASKRDTRNRENGIARITISSMGPDCARAASSSFPLYTAESMESICCCISGVTFPANREGSNPMKAEAKNTCAPKTAADTRVPSARMVAAEYFFLYPYPSVSPNRQNTEEAKAPDMTPKRRLSRRSTATHTATPHFIFPIRHI